MSLVLDGIGLRMGGEVVINAVSLTLAPKVGGLVEFYRSPARKLWTPTGMNVPDYGKLAQVWWQNVSKGISGEVTPQQAMDGLAKVDYDTLLKTWTQATPGKTSRSSDQPGWGHASPPRLATAALKEMRHGAAHPRHRPGHYLDPCHRV